MTKRTAIYARVSTDEQAEHGYSIVTQIQSCRKYAGAHGFTIEAEFREECSGAKLDRPELDKLRMMIERKEIDAVIVHTADRLSRNLAHSLIIREEWQRAGAEIHYSDRGKTQDTAEGRLSDNVQAVIAEYEREKIRERTRRGLKAKAEAGRWVGDAPEPYGYIRRGKGKEVKLEKYDVEIEVVKRIFSMYTGWIDRTPLPLRRIADTLNLEGIPSPARPTKSGRKAGRGWYVKTIKEILSRRIYVGEYEYCGQIISMPELAIIDLEQFEAAQAQRAINTQLARRNVKHEYLLRGHIFCSCNYRMSGKVITANAHRKNFYYRCLSGVQVLTMCQCREPYLRRDIADTMVWGWLSGLFTDPRKLSDGLNEVANHQGKELQSKRNRVGLLKELIDRTEKERRRAVKFASDAPDDETAADYHAQAKEKAKLKTEYTAEQEALATELGEVEMTAERVNLIEQWADEIRQGLEDDDVSFETKRRLLQWLKAEARIEYREGQRGLFMKCVLPYGEAWQALSTVTHGSATTCLAPEARRRAIRKVWGQAGWFGVEGQMRWREERRG